MQRSSCKSQPAVCWSLFQSFSINSFPTPLWSWTCWAGSRSEKLQRRRMERALLVHSMAPLRFYRERRELKPFSFGHQKTLCHWAPFGSAWKPSEQWNEELPITHPRKSEKLSGPRTLDFQIRSLFCQVRCEAFSVKSKLPTGQSLEAPSDPCKSVGGFPLFFCVCFSAFMMARRSLRRVPAMAALLLRAQQVGGFGVISW